LKRAFAAFENVADGSADLRIFEPAGPICDRRQLSVRMWSGLRDDDLVCVGINNEISVVGDPDHLPVRLRLDKEVDEFIEHGLGIEIFFRLIDDERPVVAVI
jgi:hypothetical protein